MQACTFMTLRHIGQSVGSFYLKNAKDIHGPIVRPAMTLRNRSACLEPRA